MSSLSSSVLLLGLMSITSLMAASADNFHRDVEIFFGKNLAKILDGGNMIKLSLDNCSGSGFRSKSKYLFGKFEMHIKLVRGNSAGTVTTFYISSHGRRHDEIDFEFLGNLTGQPYLLHTNIFAKGQGGREQQFYLWFDPTTSFHKYTVVWNSQRIILMVDDTPIRLFNNNEAIGVPFPNSQAMRVYSTIWNADAWATEGGRVKTNWTEAPFTASFRRFYANACIDSSGSSSHGTSESTNSLSTSTTQAWQTEELDNEARKKLRWVQNRFMVYDYCTDIKRFSQGLPPECKRPRFLQ
ncbi:hypothetical protein RHSIM_Rhsim06G0117700 [Rhododendron simsii]|uniref:Xyloglucan endotransglucosylase/hydrolase n=1 Tax=Rhododendron simsii TaxID=118357 RepID=A0A834GU97_RHOSS|nr:hypothetical protein RHSIM_Rhsim06G0117700 [Rhododendron simsii]